MSTTQETKARIELLTEGNFSSWYIDTRAHLRSKKLWEYTQELYTSDDTTTPEDGKTPQILKKEQKAMKDWEGKSQEAADLMTPTISRTVKRKLTEIEFNDGYLMFTRLRTLLQPSGSSELIRLSKEYYSIQFKSFKSMPEYLTHIKILEERIDATKVTLDTNNRTILCLSMSLPQEYQYLIQIWAVTPSITAEKARSMLLEASRQHTLALHNSPDSVIHYSNKTMGQGQSKCEHCGSTRHPSDRCWPKMMARTAMMARGDDFVDNNGTHISC